MQPFRNLPIRRKLALTMMLTSGAALVVTAVFMGSLGLSQARSRMMERATVLADIVASHSESALVTADARQAEAELSALRQSPRTLAAWLYRADGSMLARYAREPSGVSIPQPALPAPGVYLEGDFLTVCRPVVSVTGRRLGAVCMRCDARDIRASTVRHIGISAGVLAGALAVAWLVARRLQRQIAGPIVSLGQAARAVTERKDYSLRVPENGGDEVGRLVRDFNAMLATMQRHEEEVRTAHDSRARKQEQLQQELARRIEAEKKLKTAYDDVEGQVRVRTVELQKANDALRTEMALRGRMGEALESAERRFRSLIEHSTDVVALLDAEGKVLYVSPAVRRVTGADPPGVLGRNAFEWVHPEDLERARQRFAELLRSPEQPVVSEYRVRHGDGSWVWIESIGANLLDEPAVNAVVLNFRDITERRMAAEALRQSEERYRLLADNSDDIVALHDADGSRLYVSPSYYRKTGWTPAEVEGADWRSRVHPEDLPQVERAHAANLAGEPTVIEQRARCKDGSWLWLETHCKPIPGPNGRALRRLVWSHDITVRKRAEMELTRSEKRSRSIGDNVPDGCTYRLMVGSDGQSRFEYVSAGFESLFGLKPGAMSNDAAPLYALLHPDDRDEALEAQNRSANELSSFRHECRFNLSNGQTRWMRWHSMPERLPGGGTAWSGVVLDITERKRAEAAAHESYNLLHAVIESSNDPVYVYDLENRFMLVNTAVARRLGKPADQIAGKPLRQFFNEAEAGRLEAHNRAVLESGRPLNFEEAVSLSEGSRTFLVSKTPLRDKDGRGIGVVGVAHDITERKRIEEALRESEERYRTLAEAAHDLIFMVDRDDRVLYVNSFAARVIAKSPADIVGRRRSELFPADATDHQRRNLQSVFASGKPLYAEESLPTAHGEVMIGTWLSPVAAPDGSVGAVLGISRDITERVLAEQAVHESYELLRSVIESTSDPVFVKDREGRYVLVNSALAAAYGKTADEIVGKTPGQVVSPAVAAVMTAEDETVLASNLAHEFEETFVLADGVPRVFLNSKTPLRDERGRVIGIVGVAHEITGRKQAEDALRDSEARFRAVFENSLDVIHRRNLQTNCYDFISPAVEDLTGLAPSALLGKGVDALLDGIHPDDLPAVKRLLADLGGGVVSNGRIEYRLKHRDGSYRWVADRVMALKDDQGRALYLVGVARDITEQVRMRDDLERSERRYRHIVETANEGIWMVDGNWKTVYANAQMEKMLGCAPGELLGCHPFDFMDDEWRVVARSRMAEREAGQSAVHDFKFCRKDGGEIWLLCSASPITDAQGRFAGALAMFTDLTERRRAEAVLREAHVHLEQRVAQRTAELSKEVKDREHAEAALRHLSGRLLQLQDEERRRMARELHDTTAQTLAALAINLSLINQHAATLAPDVRRVLGESLALADQCSQEIRTMSYLLHPPLLDEFGLVTTLRWYADGFGKRSNIRVELDLPPKTDRLPREIETTFFRIVQEALVNIHRHSGSPIARICLTHTDRDATLIIQDEGRGMASSSPEDTRTRIGKLGVGITGMRERVRQLDGRLDIQSGRGGTTITVTIPILRDAP